MIRVRSCASMACDMYIQSCTLIRSQQQLAASAARPPWPDEFLALAMQYRDVADEAQLLNHSKQQRCLGD